MQPKVSVFNPDFSFDFDDGTTSRKEPLKRKLVQEDENNENNSDLEENNESKKELETLINKKDHVRIKTQSAKKQAVASDDYFEMPTVEEKKKKMTSFDSMNLSKPLIKALANMGMSSPTEIQWAAIPTALMGKDICACAVTGSGKTLAFMLPTLERLLYKPKFSKVTRVLVLTPTRELAVQICKVTRDLAQFTNIETCLCAGGFDVKSQEAALRLGPDICIATPGRLIDHLHNTPCFNLETVEILILDEADRMLDEYFAEQLKEVMRLCSKTRQTMLFSATMTDKVEDLVRMSLKRPVKIFINENVDVTPRLKQEFVRLRDNSDKNREVILAALIQRKFNDRVIVFVRTKQDCHRIAMLLNMLDVKAAELHGGLTQTQRLDKLNAFKDNTIDVLVATDLAARGLDIANVKTVINFSMPMTFKHYIHRVGRTARAACSGRSISLVGEDERWLVKDIVKSSKEPVKCRVIPADVIQVYRDKITELRSEIVAKLKEEQNEKLMDQMEKDITKAQNRVKNGMDSKKKKKSKNAEEPAPKRTWLKDVDYKNGGLLSDKKKKIKKNTKKENEEEQANDDEYSDDESDSSEREELGELKKKKKPKFLSKHHREQHDDIFSKKFKQNKLNSDKRRRK